jgi:hypothetical protein
VEREIELLPEARARLERTGRFPAQWS